MALKKLSVEELLSVLFHVLDIYDDEDELFLNTESDDDVFISIPNSSKSDDDNTQKPLGTFLENSFFLFPCTIFYP